jgi:ribosomal protein S18 acetylase RimI-like enzyme
MTAPDVAIRDATEEDLPAIVAMLADDPLGATRERFEDPLPVAYAEAFAAIRAQTGNHLLVACAPDGAVVGVLQLMILPHLQHTGKSRAQIEGVRVAAEYRSRGLGRYLFDHAIECARDAGCGLVQLTSDASRADALRFYESLGFEPTHVGFKLRLG